jgi:hypothetical protein
MLHNPDHAQLHKVHIDGHMNAELCLVGGYITIHEGLGLEKLILSTFWSKSSLKEDFSSHPIHCSRPCPAPQSSH